MDMYEYVATNVPDQCQALCEKYGFAVQAETTGDLGDCMEQLVAEMGEPALKDMVAIHPDRDLILEQYGTSTSGGGASTQPAAGTGCGCSKCKGAGPVSESYIHAAAQQQGNNIFHVNQAGMFIIGGLVLVTLAVIARN